MFKKPAAASLLATALFGVHASGFAASPKETLEAFHAALTSGDKAKALALLSPEVAIYEAGYVERSRDEYASHHLGGDMEFARNSTRKVLTQTERIDGNTAIVWEESETTGTSRGTPVHVFGTGTAVLEKKGDAWVIVHVHWSSRKAK
ncbi:nuclear transport factor 2 family protein [Massilia oculi]|uniref:Nuclear transport factor 2 family protein n=1 Tax=Massilia hydrophila TaxID=3044279 RepID=A0ABS7YD38_9BURK|nr:nuclear transport factor 2 family protein [Massilia oculi]MCA1856851.1 nuclear transport factor 2 family protein [Massilia oculi]